MGRFIIDYDDGIELKRVLDVVSIVIMEGKISESGGVKHYCWGNGFSDCNVFTRRKKKGQTSDSFIVRVK